MELIFKSDNGEVIAKLKDQKAINVFMQVAQNIRSGKPFTLKYECKKETEKVGLGWGIDVEISREEKLELIEE